VHYYALVNHSNLLKNTFRYCNKIYRKGDFAEGSKILLDTDQKIIWNLKNNEQRCKKFWYSNNWFECSS